MEEIDICTGYKLDGNDIDYPPSGTHALEKCEPVYETLPGWQTDTTKCRTYDSLPEQAKAYLTRISELSGVKISIVSVGPDREETIFV